MFYFASGNTMEGSSGALGAEPTAVDGFACCGSVLVWTSGKPDLKS
ncbi:MAG: hypothetical protein IJQ39_14890 [Thermoguttaceae bacterium]|nr:hypothetical protein [Thermoguttaceae bacterium]